MVLAGEAFDEANALEEVVDLAAHAFHAFAEMAVGFAEARLQNAVRKIEQGQERLLFVDDEEWLVDMWQEILESLGFRVTATTSPLDALELFRREPENIDLVITDQTMPQMTGLELTKELLSLRPDLAIILVTGFSELVTPEKAKDIGIREYIMKPLSISELTNAISRALGEKPLDS